MQYIDVEDVKKITGCGPNKSYQIIRELNKKYKRRFPDYVPILGKIPKWFFEEIMGTGIEGKVTEDEEEI